MTRNPSRLLLTPLAFVSPRVIAAIVDGTAPADLTVTMALFDPGAAPLDLFEVITEVRR